MGWLIVVGALLISPAAAQEEEAPSAEGMERSAQALELLAREAKIQFEQRRAEIELKAMEARIDLEREEHEVEMAERRAKAGHPAKTGKRPKDNGGAGIVLVWILVVNILLTIWVCKEDRADVVGADRAVNGYLRRRALRDCPPCRHEIATGRGIVISVAGGGRSRGSPRLAAGPRGECRLTQRGS